MPGGKPPLVFRLNDHGQGPDVVREVFLERGWVEFDEDTQYETDWNIWWRTSRFRNCDYEQLLPYQRLNHYPKSAGITRKDCLVRNLKRMKGVHGARAYNFSPLSFNLPNDYTRYVSEYGKFKAKMDPKLFSWICKPADMSRGRGIFVFRDISELQYDCNAVVQRYIANPLLIGGYKFDIRIYVVVPSFHPLTIYVFQEGLVRFGTEKYDMSSLQNIYSHLTNTSINKHSPSYSADKERVGPGCKWTITQLRHYFRQSSIDDRLLWTKVTNIIILTLLIQAPQVPKERNCFELYGFDILVDEKMKPWLLEVNFSPAMSTDCHVDVIVKKPMLHNLMDMMNFKDNDTERGNSETKPAATRSHRANHNANLDSIDRNSSVSRLSARESMQRINSKISGIHTNAESSMTEQTISFIEQENLLINRKNDDHNMCFGLPLVHPSDDERGESDSSGQSSAKSDCDANEFTGPPSCRSGHYTPASTVATYTSIEKQATMLEKGRTRRSASRRMDLVHSNKHDKGSVKSFSNSDSGYSSISMSSDNSERTSASSAGHKSKVYASKGKRYSFQSEILLETPREAGAFQIKSLLPNENSSSIRKMLNRSVTPVGNGRSKLRSMDRALSRSYNHAAPRPPGHEKVLTKNYLRRSVTRFGGTTARSEMDLNRRSRPQMVVSSMSTIIKTPRDKDFISLGLTGTNRATMYRKQTTSIPAKSNAPPPNIGDFFLVFPFNESTWQLVSEGSRRLASPCLDAHAVIRETQKLLREVQQDAETCGGDREKRASNKAQSGHLPYGQPVDGERLWAPLKVSPDDK